MAWTKLIFWLSLSVPVYAYFGYPLMLLLMRNVFRRPVLKRPFEPAVTLLIPAYNEAPSIAAKIKNSLALEYPVDKLEILIACDGPQDGTVEIARSMADGVRVRVLDFKKNRGKILAMNDAVREARGEILVFSDATALLYPDALKWLIANFADPAVGAACGRYTVIRAGEVGIGKSEDFYWKYETFLKTQESQIDSMLGSHGHLHAIRREIYPYPLAGTINDDYIISISVLAKGYRAVFEPAAIGYEEATEMAGFGRRVRIMAGNLQQLREIKGLLRPLRPMPLFFFLSHKAIRLAVPFAMVAALLANLLLLWSPFYLALFWLQIVFYTLAIVGARIPLRPKILLLPYYFSMMNAAVFFGLYHTLTSRRGMAWK